MANAFEVVVRELQERSDVVAQAITGGAAKDYAEYRFLCGELRGLSQAKMYIQDLVRQMETDDE